MHEEQGFAGEGLACLRGERLVFRGLAFRLKPGEALILEGPNGSGKSSLLRLCAGLLAPAMGRLTYDGADIARDPEAHRLRLAYVGHLDAVKPVLSVAEMLAFAARLAPGGGTGAGKTTAAALERFGLEDLAPVPGRFLSAGQRRRVALARLLVRKAVLWLLDEPTNSLDRDAVALLGEAIAEHCQAGGLVMAASHVDLGLKAPVSVLRLEGPGATEEEPAP